MTDRKVYRIAGISSLATIAVFFFEFPFYLVRGTFPTMAETGKLAEFAARSDTNIMTCIFLDLIILSLILVFFAGFRHLVLRTNPQQEWIGTLFFGVGVIYVTLTLIADSLQAATVVDAITPPADGIIIRAMTESYYLMYGAVALWFMALLMAIASYATLASHALKNPILPKWSAWLGYACSVACLAFVPTMFIRHVDVREFYNPAGWGPEAIANGFPLAAWMIALGILLLRKREPAAIPTDLSS